MKSNFIRTIAVIIVLAASFSSCKKGDTGPSGPAGPAGANGTNGINGVATISTTTLNVTGWTWDNTNKWRYASFINNVPALSQINIDRGMIMVYGMSAGNFIPLPYTINVGTSNIQFNETYEFSLNSITIYNSLSNGTDPTPSPSLYRLVVIPNGMVKPNVNYKNYFDVKRAHNLAD